MFHNINNFLHNVGDALSGTVHNPMLPYSAPIMHGPFPGRRIQIQGHIPYHSNRFEINIQSGPGANSPNINLHFNPRFDQNTVVRNSCKYNSWGGEERGHLPFHKGGHFDITIQIDHFHYTVIVNGQHYCTFAHRSPFQEGNYISISGDVQVSLIRQF